MPPSPTAQPAGPEPQPPAAGRRRSGLWCALARCGRTCHRLVVLGQWTLFAVLLVVIWLSYFGVPRAWVERALASLRDRGLYLTVERVRLDLLHGVALDDAALYETPQSGRPVLQAEKITLGVDPRAWRRREPGLRSVRVVQGVIRLDLGAADGASAELLNLRLAVPYAYARIETNGVRLLRGRAAGLGAQWQGSGFVHWPAPRASGAPAAGAPPPLRPAAVLAEARRRRPVWLRPVLEELSAVAPAQTPAGTVTFEWWPDQPDRSRVNAALEGGKTHCRGLDFTGWRAEVEGRGADWSARGWVMQGLRQAAVAGSLDGRTGRVQGEVTSSLAVATLRQLAPPAARAVYDRSGVQVRGPLAFEAHAGPAAPAAALASLHGWFTARNVRARGVEVPVFHASFARAGAQLALADIQAEVGRGRQRGALTGRCTVDLATGGYLGAVRTSFAPHALAPLLEVNESHLVSQLQLFGRPPATELSFAGGGGPLPSFGLTGRVAVTNFAFRGVPVVAARADVTLTNGVLDLRDAFVVRDEGYAAGRVRINFDDDFIDLDAAGTVNPQAAAQMIGSDFAAFMQRFTFQGPVHTIVCGRLDIGPTMQATRLRATAEGARLGWHKLIADYAAFNLRLDDARLVLTNAAGAMWSGPFAGAAVFDDIASATQCAYAVSAAITNADFAVMVQDLGGGRLATNPAYTGRFTAGAQLHGIIGPEMAASTVGTGTVQITEGQIFRVPALGGLFQLLGKIIPGLGYLSQTELTASYTVRGQKIQTDDVRIKGHVLSLSGRGFCGFNGDVNYRVQVQLLRGGLTADILRVLTFPVTKLLEFRLLGTVTEPRWRPENLPKELFLKFD